MIFISSESAVQIPAEMVHHGMTKTAQVAIARGIAELSAPVCAYSDKYGPLRLQATGQSQTQGWVARQQGQRVPALQAGLCAILTRKIGAETMAGYATTRLSSKGQVVIPEEIRNDLGLREGDQFVVIGEGDAVILKAITPPRIEEFNKLLGQVRSAAKRTGIKRTDLKSAIVKVRHRTK
jgi:AbrB family looped-hinge helix DNA binding protein